MYEGVELAKPSQSSINSQSQVAAPQPININQQANLPSNSQVSNNPPAQANPSSNLSLDPNQPQGPSQSNPPEKKEEKVLDKKAQLELLCQNPLIQKYSKLLRIGVRIQEIQSKMQSEGVDISILDVKLFRN